MVQRSILLLSLFVHFIFADVLSTGENVALFVDRMIGDNGTQEIEREKYFETSHHHTQYTLLFYTK
jgi:hypothetical protein